MTGAETGGEMEVLLDATAGVRIGAPGIRIWEVTVLHR
jgi:hypothetical protein